MEESIIQFFTEETDYTIAREEFLRAWLGGVARSEHGEVSFINYVLCSDEYLLDINRQYLDHDDYTDVITFPYSESGEPIEGDVFISIDRVSENAGIFGTTVFSELCRVMVHGLLHLLGYDDKTDPDREQMRAKEDYYLSLLAEHPFI